MANAFSFLKNSDDERAVKDVLSQAMDHSVLEQIVAINCSSFSTSDNFPSHLENRFRKLKSFPTATSVVAPHFPPSKSKSFRPQSSVDSNLKDQHHTSTNSVDFEQIPDLKKCSQKPSPSTNNLEEHEQFGDFEQIRDEKKASNSRSKPKSSTNVKSLKSKSWSNN
ncbi:hypothetical protein SSX86_016693 [Deinandra increscens subsp. villosa]|uniref:Uncharacterized protein n=1 Tax=Deinandra increscens subsp. villosa TaxID=3103831 RepID=A0AAP0H0C0_9ASTR